MQQTIIRVKYAPIKLDFAQYNQMYNIKSATSIN